MAYTFFADAEHGWLKVILDELKGLEIDKEISTFSYQRGDYIYIEEDGDLDIFLKAKGVPTKGIVFHGWWRGNVVEKNSKRSSIRNYDRYMDGKPFDPKEL